MNCTMRTALRSALCSALWGLAVVALAATAEAKTFRWANDGDTN